MIRHVPLFTLYLTLFTFHSRRKSTTPFAYGSLRATHPPTNFNLHFLISNLQSNYQVPTGRWDLLR